MKFSGLLLTCISLLPLFSSCSSRSDAANNYNTEPQHGFWVTVEEAQELALDNNKYILLDIYTEWCGFCRRMNAETYANSKVQQSIDDYFYAVRVDAESTDMITFLGEKYTKRDMAMLFGVRSFPTTVFLTPQGEPIAAQPGFIDAARFEKMLTFVGSESYKTQTFQQYAESQ